MFFSSVIISQLGNWYQFSVEIFVCSYLPFYQLILILKLIVTGRSYLHVLYSWKLSNLMMILMMMMGCFVTVFHQRSYRASILNIKINPSQKFILILIALEHEMWNQHHTVPRGRARCWQSLSTCVNLCEHEMWNKQHTVSRGRAGCWVLTVTVNLYDLHFSLLFIHGPVPHQCWSPAAFPAALSLKGNL